MNLVVPVTRLLEHEIRNRLEVAVELRHDSYALDMVSRSQEYPIEVMVGGTRRWVLRNGNHRLPIARERGAETIPAIIHRGE